MEDFNGIIEIAQTAPLLAIFYILWRGGIIKVSNNGKVNSTNGYQTQIDALKKTSIDLEKHAEVANSEMGDIRKSMLSMAKDVAFIRGKLDK